MAKKIPLDLPEAKGLHHLTNNPGRWFLLARRIIEEDEPKKLIPYGPWDYGFGGGNKEKIEEIRGEILKAAEDWRVFCPQRRLVGEVQWIGMALINPPKLYRRLPPRPRSM